MTTNMQWVGYDIWQLNALSGVQHVYNRMDHNHMTNVQGVCKWQELVPALCMFYLPVPIGFTSLELSRISGEIPVGYELNILQSGAT